MLNISSEEKQKFEKLLDIPSSPSPSSKKLRNKAYSFRKIFTLIPGILCVCVCNSVALGNANLGSDIDIFIITRENRLWTSRILITLILTLLRQRKTSKIHAGKFCLSFFISSEKLDIGDIVLENDIYLHFWMHSLIPVVNKKFTFEKFQDTNAYWSGYQKGGQDKKGRNKKKNKIIFFETVGDIFEKFLKNIFLRRTLKHYEKLGKPFGVIITDNMLKFHNTDARKKIIELIKTNT